MLEIGGTTVLISGPELVREESGGKLAPSVAAEGEPLGALLIIELDNISEASVVEGTGGRFVDKIGPIGGAKEAELKLGELPLAAESRDNGTSGKLEPPVGKEALKLGYCNGCCIGEGIDSPGGGRSKDCWCN